MYLSFGEQSLFITKQNETKTSLEIAFSDLSIREVKALPAARTLSFPALLGLKRIGQHALLLLAAEATTVTTIGLSPICEIKSVSWVPLAPEHQHGLILQQLAEDLEEMRLVFAGGLHYYSDLYDLSLPYLCNKIRAPDAATREYYDQFVWNLNLAQMDGCPNDTQSRLFLRYCQRVIQGYLEECSCMLPGSQKVRYILVSRRSSRKAGTRFYARGIDDLGSVANFCETEQIVEVSELVFTHLQIRGSVPAFFAQTGVNGVAGALVIERSAALTLAPFARHFETLSLMYGRIFAVNLLSEKKAEERLLSNFYEQLVQANVAHMPYLRYQFYDFHEECKNNRFENSERLLDQLAGVIDAFGFTCYDFTQEKFLREQTGVMRTNCLDCLDRTNYVQSRLALRALRTFLGQFVGRETHELIEEKRLLDLPVNEEYPLLGGFSALWADNGDSISLLYTGIPSTHTDITRNGERTLLGAVNHKFRSLMRFYTQFTDHRKQNAINNLTMPTSPRKSDYQHDFYSTLSVSIENSEDPEEVLKEVSAHLHKERPALIVYFVFAKQRGTWLDKLRCYFNSEVATIKTWIRTLDQFSEQSNYILIGDLENESCWLGVFCKREATRGVSEIKKENLSGSVSVGEALLIKMKLESSSFIFAGINCSALDDFLKVFDEIHEKGFQTSKLGLFKSASLLDLDYRVVMGSTGAQLRLSQKELVTLSKLLESTRERKEHAQAAKILSQMLDADEMNLQELRYRNKYIRQYSEGPIEFVPSGNRLLFWNGEGVILRVRNYNSLGTGGVKAVLDYEVGRGARRGGE